MDDKESFAEDLCDRPDDPVQGAFERMRVAEDSGGPEAAVERKTDGLAAQSGRDTTKHQGQRILDVEFIDAGCRRVAGERHVNARRSVAKRMTW
ncbi:MAG TPA: hypothetical protein VFY73_25545 [Ideonella sp.]|uniref:hypothetical protein n=1 Tax=Ideonella sp. TaxID=1929293 RepID=UPI002E33B13D|nr:hypothetical protein [Ideonella sp.]HEX5687395.1 hypothetical protein [Ideonella sp.]